MKGHLHGANMNYNLNKSSIAIIVLIRVVLGWLMFYSGITKLLEPGWSAAGFLQNSTYGPLKDLFLVFASNPVVDSLVMFGLTLIGLSLILGLFVKLSSFFGIILMILFYLPRFPPQTGVVDQHIIYILLFFMFIIIGAGRYLGLDYYIRKSKFVKNNVFRALFG